MIPSEVYVITVEHYMQTGEGQKIRIEEPIVIKSIYDRRYGNSAILLNEMFDKIKEYALSKAREIK